MSLLLLSSPPPPAILLPSALDLPFSLSATLHAVISLDPNPIDLPFTLSADITQVVVLTPTPPYIPFPLDLSATLANDTQLRARTDLNFTLTADLFVAKEAPHARIYPYNRWSDLSLGDISASSSYPEFPPSNTQRQERSKIWRSTSLTSPTPWIVRDLGQPFRINSICLVSTNSSRTGRFRVAISNYSNFSFPLYDSGWVPIWGPILGPDSGFGFEDSRYPGDEILNMLRFCHETIRTVRTFDFGMVEGQYIRIEFSDAENLDGFFELAWVYAGLSVTLTEGVAYDFEWWMKSENKVDRAYSGRLWTDIFYRQLICTAKIVTYPRERYFGLWQFLADYLGDTKEFVITFRDDSLLENFWMSVYAHFGDVPKFSMQEGGEIFDETITFEELP
jgi:hypothetical protein